LELVDQEAGNGQAGTPTAAADAPDQTAAPPTGPAPIDIASRKGYQQDGEPKTPNLDRLCSDALARFGLRFDLASGLSVAKKFYVVCYDANENAKLSPARIRDTLKHEIPPSEYPVGTQEAARNKVKTGIVRGKDVVHRLQTT